MIFEVLKWDDNGKTIPAGLLVGGRDIVDAWDTLEHLGIPRGMRTLRCVDWAGWEESLTPCSK